MILGMHASQRLLTVFALLATTALISGCGSSGSDTKTKSKATGTKDKPAPVKQVETTNLAGAKALAKVRDTVQDAGSSGRFDALVETFSVSRQGRFTLKSSVNVQADVKSKYAKLGPEAVLYDGERYTATGRGEARCFTSAGAAGAFDRAMNNELGVQAMLPSSANGLQLRGGGGGGLWLQGRGATAQRGAMQADKHGRVVSLDRLNPTTGSYRRVTFSYPDDELKASAPKPICIS